MLLFFTAVHRFGGERPLRFPRSAPLSSAASCFRRCTAASFCCGAMRTSAEFMSSRRSSSPSRATRCPCTSVCGSASVRWRRTSVRTRPGRAASAVPSAAHLRCCCSAWIAQKWLGYAPDYARLALVGAVANVFGQLGDLSMSLIKREAGIKDYSHLFLTHGGMLDRFDSTMFIAPVV